jgi:hypothetical protein
MTNDRAGTLGVGLATGFLEPALSAASHQIGRQLLARAPVDPLREILAGTRSIMYFNARADAGLAGGALAAGLGLLFWPVLGTVVVRWYDRRGFERLSPELLAHISGSVAQYRSEHAAPSTTGHGATPAEHDVGPPAPKS